METTINERIEKVIREFGYKSTRSFAEKIGVAQTSLAAILKGSEPRYSTLCKILAAEPTLCSDWLLLGKGEMCKPKAEPNNYQIPEANIDFASDSRCPGDTISLDTKTLLAIIRSQQEEINRYSQRYDALLAKIENNFNK